MGKLKFSSFTANATPNLEELASFCRNEINSPKSDNELIYIPIAFCYFFEVYYSIRYLVLKFDPSSKIACMSALVVNLLNYVPILFLIHKSLYFYTPCKILLVSVLKMLAFHIKKTSNGLENNESYLTLMLKGVNLQVTSILSVAQKVLEPCILDPKSTKISLSIIKNKGLIGKSLPSNNTELQFEYEQAIQLLVSHENFRYRVEDNFHELYHLYLEFLMLQKNWNTILKQSIVKVADEEFDDLVMHRIYSRFLLLSSLLASFLNIENFPKASFSSKCFEVITEMADKQIYQHPELIFVPYLTDSSIGLSNVNFTECLYDTPLFHLLFRPHLQLATQNFSYSKLKEFQLPSISNENIATLLSDYSNKSKNLGILTCYNVEFPDLNSTMWKDAMDWHLEKFAKTRKLRDAAKLIKEPLSYFNSIQIVD